MKNSILVFIFLASFTMSAQIKGVVKDSISGNPVSYVNIWVENENFGTTSEENGQFSIHEPHKSRRLIFSALGYEKKIVNISNAAEVRLKPTAVALDEITIVKRHETRQIEIGKSDEIFQAFDNGPRMDVKFFPYKPSYKKTRYIKQVVINTDSRIDNATLRLHFYGIDANGLPGDELLEKDFIVSVDKGVKRTTFKVTKFNLVMPKQGIFVGFEKLMIAANKVERTVTDANTNTKQTLTNFYPFFLYNVAKSDTAISFSGGKWVKTTPTDVNDPLRQLTINVPAINLILTN